MRVLVVVATAAVVAAGCTESVVGSGSPAAEAVVPPTPTSAAPTTPAPATPRPTPRPAPTTPRAAVIPAAYAGTWTGTVRQPDGVIKNWTAVLVLPRGRTAGRFTVAGYCSGPARVVTAARSRLVLQENITSDPKNRCAAGGTITLVPAGGGRLRCGWVDGDHKSNTASGTLSRA